MQYAETRESEANLVVMLTRRAAACAVPGSPTKCAIAIALKWLGFTEIEVGNSIVRARPPARHGVEQPRQRWRLRALDRRDVRRFDKDGSFEPGPITLYATAGTSYTKAAKREWRLRKAAGLTSECGQRASGPAAIRQLSTSA